MGFGVVQLIFISFLKHHDLGYTTIVPYTICVWQNSQKTIQFEIEHALREEILKTFQKPVTKFYKTQLKIKSENLH